MNLSLILCVLLTNRVILFLISLLIESDLKQWQLTRCRITSNVSSFLQLRMCMKEHFLGCKMMPSWSILRQEALRTSAHLPSSILQWLKANAQHSQRCYRHSVPFCTGRASAKGGKVKDGLKYFSILCISLSSEYRSISMSFILHKNYSYVSYEVYCSFGANLPRELQSLPMNNPEQGPILLNH